MDNQPIRILHWGLLNSRGGIESFIMNLYRNIDRNKVQFDFLEDHNLGEFIYEDEIEQMGGRVFRVLYSKKENYEKSKNCLIDFLKEHPEIVGIHVHANFFYASLLKDAKKAGLPIRILHSHNSSQDENEGVKKKIRNFIVKRDINKYPSDYFTCSDLATKYMFPKKESIWIKNGIDVDKFDYDVEIRNKIRADIGIKDETVIGFVGNLREQKNPFFVIDIFEKYYHSNNKSKLIIIGEGKFEDKLKLYVKEKQLENNVLFIGMVSNVNEYYQAMDAFLLPSLYEGLPVVLVEAQTSGLPCFVADNITRQIKVTDNIKYISIDDKPEEWAKIIQGTLDTFKRQSNKKEVCNAGFYMKDVAKQVENYYLNNC